MYDGVQVSLVIYDMLAGQNKSVGYQEEVNL